MKKIIKFSLLVMLSINSFSQNSIKKKIQGTYFTNVQVENYETGEATNVTYYIFFGKSYATLNFSNSDFAVCEGKYFYKEKQNILYLIRDENDGRPCPSFEDKEDKNIFSDDSEMIAIKKVKNKYYIKSKRFYVKKWQLLQLK
jgi:hypothetical protein